METAKDHLEEEASDWHKINQENRLQPHVPLQMQFQLGRSQPEGSIGLIRKEKAVSIESCVE